MGGVSRAELRFERHLGRPCLHLYGDVRLDNDGGFIQMALDLDPLGSAIDAREYRGLRLLVLGNGERYSAHLRTEDLVRPWQSYRAQFAAPPEWREVQLPFSGFVPHRVEAPLDLARLRRLGLVAIGRAFCADLRVARVEFYR
jgi:hypothetical protein